MPDKKLNKQKKGKKSKKKNHRKKSSAKPSTKNGTSQMKRNIAGRPRTSSSKKLKERKTKSVPPAHKKSKSRPKSDKKKTHEVKQSKSLKKSLKKVSSKEKSVSCAKENAPPELPEKQVETILIAPDDYCPIYSYKAKPKSAKEVLKTTNTKQENADIKHCCFLKAKTTESADGPKVMYNAPDFQHLYNRSKKQNDKVNMKEMVEKCCKSPEESEEDDDDEDSDEDDDKKNEKAEKGD